MWPPAARGEAGCRVPRHTGASAHRCIRRTGQRNIPTMAQAQTSSRRERKKAENGARIVRSATELFNLKGYQATSIEDITEAADIAPRTFYSYFEAKVDVAMVQFDHWIEQFIGAMYARPSSESPDEMHRNALADLGAQGYVTGRRLRDESGRPFPPMGVGAPDGGDRTRGGRPHLPDAGDAPGVDGRPLPRTPALPPGLDRAPCAGRRRHRLVVRGGARFRGGGRGGPGSSFDRRAGASRA